MFYPALTRFSCAECQQFVYDVAWPDATKGTGDRKRFCGGTRDFVRPKSSPPPCGECPKESPDKELEHVLTADNWQTWQIYRQMRATGGASLTDEMRCDPLLMHNLALIDRLAKAKERQDLGREIAFNLAAFIR